MARYIAEREGAPEAEARRACFFVDTRGLVRERGRARGARPPGKPLPARAGPLRS